MIEHDIITTYGIPIKQPDRRVLPQLKPKARKHLQKMAETRIYKGIHKSITSTSGSGEEERWRYKAML